MNCRVAVGEFDVVRVVAAADDAGGGDVVASALREDIVVAVVEALIGEVEVAEAIVLMDIDARVVDTNDIRMRQAPCGMRLVEKHFAAAIATFFIAELLGVRNFQCDLAVDVGIVSKVYRTHGSAAYFLQDFVLA